MTDILIRGVPNDLLVTIDSQAKRAGLSRSDYLLRALAGEHGVNVTTSNEPRHLSKSLTGDEVKALSDEEYKERALAGLDAVMEIGDPAEQAETGQELMRALAETRRAEGRPF